MTVYRNQGQPAPRCASVAHGAEPHVQTSTAAKILTNRITLFAAAGCAILLMAGCAAEPGSPTNAGGSGGTVAPPSAAASPGGGGTLDACKLLTDSDLSTFTGKMGNKPGTPSGDGCTFQLSDTARATVSPKSITKEALDTAMSSQSGRNVDAGHWR